MRPDAVTIHQYIVGTGTPGNRDKGETSTEMERLEVVGLQDYDVLVVALALVEVGATRDCIRFAHK